MTRSVFSPPFALLQPVELTDGSIVINVRNQNKYHCNCRIVVRSKDGGMTLPIDELHFDQELVDPAIAAGALQKGGVLFFTNPSHEQLSKNTDVHHYPSVLKFLGLMFKMQKNMNLF